MLGKFPSNEGMKERVLCFVNGARGRVTGKTLPETSMEMSRERGVALEAGNRVFDF